jgi:hypothetical protein
MFIVRDVSEFRKLRGKKRVRPLKGCIGFLALKKSVDINLIPADCEIHLNPEKKYAELHIRNESVDVIKLAEELDAIAYNI